MAQTNCKIERQTIIFGFVYLMGYAQKTEPIDSWSSQENKVMIKSKCSSQNINRNLKYKCKITYNLIMWSSPDKHKRVTFSKGYVLAS